MAASAQREHLDRLISQSWNEYDRLRDSECILQPAIPILYFGDSERYFSSPLKVVTVGLNPSCAEFPDDDPFSRFPNMSAVPAERGGVSHLTALDSYFRCNPYGQWFASFEPILAGMECSFYDKCRSTALHTDLLSPIATRPTWSKLPRSEHECLTSEGVKLWHSLIRLLAPDVILVSIARRYLRHIEFPLSPSRLIWKLDRARPYEVSAALIQIQAAKPSLLAFGRAAQKPFGLISDVSKRDIGATIVKEHMNFCCLENRSSTACLRRPLIGADNRGMEN